MDAPRSGKLGIARPTSRLCPCFVGWLDDIGHVRRGLICRLEIGASTNECLQAALELAAGKQHAAITAETAKADIGAESNHSPVKTAARVGFAQADDIVEEELKRRTAT